MSETQASLESTVTAAQDQSGLSQSESPPVLSPIVTTAEQRRAVLLLASLPGDEAQPKVPASVSSVAIASLAMSSVAGSVTSSRAPIGVVSSLTSVGGVFSSMLSVRESRSTAELERMHTSPGALPFAAELVECAYAGATRSHDDDETTVRGGDASSVSSDETLELTPQATVRDTVTGRSGPQAMATSSYYDLSLAATGPSMTVTSHHLRTYCVTQQPTRR